MRLRRLSTQIPRIDLYRHESGAPAAGRLRRPWGNCDRFGGGASPQRGGARSSPSPIRAWRWTRSSQGECTRPVSYDAGQFRVGARPVLDSGRAVHPNDQQRDAIEVAKRMIWWLCGSFKGYKLTPSPERAESCEPASTASASRLLGNICQRGDIVHRARCGQFMLANARFDSRRKCAPRTAKRAPSQIFAAAIC
jgi:hypothetical protein